MGYWDMLAKREEMKQKGMLMAKNAFARNSREEVAGKMRGLLGQAEQPAVLGELGRFTTQLQAPQAGYGLRGSDQGIEAQQDYLLGAMQAGLPEDQALGLLSAGMTKPGFGDFESQKDRLAAIRGIGGDYKKQVAPFKKSIQYYNDSASLVNKAGGVDKMSGTDDFIIMRNLLKQSLPDESVMGDDLANIRLASGGVPGWAAALIAQLTGGGYQGMQARREILTTMKNLADTRSVERDEIRGQYTGLTAGIEGVDTKDFMLDAKQAAPLPFGVQTTPPTAAEAAAELRRRNGL